MTRLIAALTLVAFVAGCGGLRDSRINPFNWFSKDKEERIAVDTDAAAEVDPRGLVREISSLKVDRAPGGAIISAYGLPPTQGYWEAELLPLNDEIPDKGTLVYEFRLMAPTSPQQVVNVASREVLAGLFVSEQTLIGVRRIEVRAALNKRSVRR